MSTAQEPSSQRIALVTGASSGIGRAIALALAPHVSAVALVGRDIERLEATKRDIQLGKGRAATFVCDLQDPAAIESLPKRVRVEFGDVSILVNNAGVAESAPFLKTSHELWSKTLAIDLTAVFLLCQAFLPGMLAANQGRIIQIASTAGHVGYPYVAAYCAAKHGVIGLTRALALEVATKGITVNAICPSFVDTPMTEQSVSNIVSKTGRSAEEAKASLAAMNPQKRLVTPEEIAALCAYLASDAARGINGQALNVCGGAVQT